MPGAIHNFPVFRQQEDKPRSVANWAVIGIFLIMAFSAVAAARDFLMPVTLALLLFFVFTPLRRFAQRRGIPDGITAAVVTLGILATVIVLAYAASGPINRAAENLPTISDRLEQKFESVQESFRKVQEAAERIDGATTVANNSGEGTTITIEQSQETTLGSVVKFTPSLLSQIVFTLFLLFFMIASGDLLYLKIVQSFDTMRDKRTAYLALREIEDSLGNYLGAITIINACLGIAVGTLMWAWGMPAPLLFGVGAFLLNFIPYLGSITGIVISTIVALVVMPDLFTPLMVGLSYLALTSLEGQLITPYFVSRRLQMNAVVVFLAVALWAWLWSVLGMVIAVPVLVVLRVLAEHIPGWQKFGNFLAGEDPPALEDEDEEEARDLVEAGAGAEDAKDAADATQSLDGPQPAGG
ncbi:MAG: AI-2E family transporter [Paracoccus sp. (in: a-proteobacteria)]|uniref:AI-2E family transporter n=1 Tax=Paracoccus sp. TaxID=267 RepID=UPI0026DEBA9E|nr:AI-2E family transporter [Paracoccus sp. (in: a-proteobacteria)]MDO5613094.1 AI-2E family transporter [Paracoccus sp. (in: a-proteobacteria)]